MFGTYRNRQEHGGAGLCAFGAGLFGVRDDRQDLQKHYAAKRKGEHWRCQVSPVLESELCQGKESSKQGPEEGAFGIALAELILYSKCTLV